MRQAKVFRNDNLAGTLTNKDDGEYEFRYDDVYFANSSLQPISLTLPKSQQVHTSDHLFPFFYNMLAEGVNRKLQCRQLKIAENDYFGLLLATAFYDTIGAVTLRNIRTGSQ